MAINLNDFTYKLRSDGVRRDKIYHLYCDTCGGDRGYNAKYLNARECNPCASKKKMAKVSSEDKSKRGRHAVSFVKNHAFTNERRKKISVSNTGKVHSLERKKKNSALKQGIPLSQWKDFIYNTDDPKRSLYKLSRINLKVFELADFTCLVCSKRGGKLHGHHLDNWKQYKDKRYDLTNIVCLCIGCHKAFHSEFGTQNNTKEQFEIFIKEKYGY